VYPDIPDSGPAYQSDVDGAHGRSDGSAGGWLWCFPAMQRDIREENQRLSVSATPPRAERGRGRQSSVGESRIVGHGWLVWTWMDVEGGEGRPLCAALGRLMERGRTAASPPWHGKKQRNQGWTLAVSEAALTGRPAPGS